MSSSLSQGLKSPVVAGSKVIIAGGAGFIGCNAASRFMARGCEVVILDNFSRAGTLENVRWLKGQGQLSIIEVDIRDSARIANIIHEHRDAALLLHLAAQVSVLGAVADPRKDFEVNAAGTLNLLEAVRIAEVAAPFIYSSTNKVYGSMEGIPVEPNGTRYKYRVRTLGIAEHQPLDFHSPYACSKGAADQYVLDYHRIYGLNTVVFRQSCIYGTRQFGVEEQGWVAWFAIAAELGKPITIFGDGKQVRDLLFADDLIDAYEAAAANIGTVAGSVFNIGGGPANAVSVLEVLGHLQSRHERHIDTRHQGWRPGDQKVYISDIRQAAARLEWRPSMGWQNGIDRIAEWVRSNRALFN